jgi:hypothetical protein
MLGREIPRSVDYPIGRAFGLQRNDNPQPINITPESIA